MMPFAVIDPDSRRDCSLYGCCLPTIDSGMNLAREVLAAHGEVNRLLVSEYGESDPCSDFLGNDPPLGAQWNSICGYVFERSHAGRAVEVRRNN